MFNLYSQHRGSMIVMPTIQRVEEARELAEASARLGYDAFYRVFEALGANRERFVTAFSVLNGQVVEHPDVTFPAAHF